MIRWKNTRKSVKTMVEIIDAENGLDIDGFKAAAENVYDYFAEDWGDMPDLIRAVQP